MKTWKIRILQLFLPFSFLSPLAQCHHDSAPTRTWRFCLSWSHIMSPERKEKMRSSVSRESPERLLCLWLPQLPQLLQLLASLCWVPWIFPTSWCFNNSTILSCYGAGIGIESFPTLVCNVCPIVKLWFGLSQAHCTCATRDQPIEFCRRQVVFWILDLFISFCITTSFQFIPQCFSPCSHIMGHAGCA